jgi:Haem-binding domain
VRIRPHAGSGTIDGMFERLKRGGRKKLVVRAALGVLLLLALIQAIPYGRSHSNPPVTLEPRWDSPATRELAARACFDCHSNLTVWRWYSNIAPGSWLIQRDVDAGRGQFNFSEWDKPQDVSVGDLVDVIRSGSMPQWYYTLLHPNASLNAAEKNALIRGLEATLAASPPKAGGG